MRDNGIWAYFMVRVNLYGLMERFMKGIINKERGTVMGNIRSRMEAFTKEVG